MRTMTVEEMSLINGGCIGIALAILAIDAGLIGVMVGVYMSYKLNHPTPPDFGPPSSELAG